MCIDDDVFRGLWPEELCERKLDYTFCYRAKIVTTPFVAEMATSGKSVCRKCREHIAFNDVRIGALRWLPGIGKAYHFYHGACFKRPHNLTTLSDITVLDSLTEDGKRTLQKLLTQAPTKRRKTRVKECPNSP